LITYTIQNKDHDAEVVILNDNANFVRSIPIHLGRKPMVHDASITSKYVIIYDLPLLFTPEEMFKENGGLIRSHSDKIARIGLLPMMSKMVSLSTSAKRMTSTFEPLSISILPPA